MSKLHKVSLNKDRESINNTVDVAFIFDDHRFQAGCFSMNHGRKETAKLLRAMARAIEADIAGE